MPKELNKNFEIKEIEQKWYQEWIKEGIFIAGNKDSKNLPPYVIMMPPPNVTGALHNGHALFVTLQDILCRFHRMKGRDVLWMPGTDHAGIATQSVVERELKKNQNKNKNDIGREAFLDLVYKWKDKHGDKIISQLKRMGASADWSRLRFTMDEQCSKAVRTAFAKLWEQGLIYRKERLISWDKISKTALSNEEVDHIEKDGELCFFAYKLKNKPELEIVVATTRLETMLGDTAIAVNPHDDRYKHLIGEEVVHPFFEGRKINIIADNFVDKEFGSGAVKITPAHDPNDFAMKERHNLSLINIFDLDGKINEHGGKFAGLDKVDAQKAIKEELKLRGLFRKIENIKHMVAISSRTSAIIEPMLSRQYFVNTKPLAQKAYEAVESGEVRIIPSYFKKTWDHFLLNIEDWCISRQLWWGHRIPVFYHIKEMYEAISSLKESTPKSLIKALNEKKSDEEILKIALNELSEEKVKSFSYVFVDAPCDMSAYIQEEDVLDTWFSSGLWPFSTLGWPENTPDLLRYYPSHVMETGFDILFFWVARMMMFGIHFLQKPPFKDIYLHSMVRDAYGQKMSKSLGNAIDPVDVMDGITLTDLMAKFETYPVPKDLLPKVLAGIKKDFPEGIPSAGADGLRLSLAIFSGQGNDVKFNIPRVLGYRAFLNKLWNATRFSLLNIGEEKVSDLKDVYPHLSLADKYILSRLMSTISKVENYLNEYKFSDAAQEIYHFFWTEFCDQYIECAKVAFRSKNKEEQMAAKSVLVFLLDNSMRLIHPICPFISEEIWQNLPISEYRTNIKFCATAPFPKSDEKLVNMTAEKDFILIFEAGAMVRNIRQSSNIPANKPLNVKLLAKDKNVKDILENERNLIIHLGKIADLGIYLRGEISQSENSLVNSQALFDVIIEMDGLKDAGQEAERLKGLLEKLRQEINVLKERLANESFVKRAPEKVVQNYKNELSALLEKYEQLELALNSNKKI